MAKPCKEPLTVPFTVAIDHREKTPFRFHNLRSDVKDGERNLEVPVQFTHLPSGDYSIIGYELSIAIERKSLADLYSTLGQNRDRFQNEIVRLNGMHYAAIVIEAPWGEILTKPPSFSKLDPKVVYRTAIAWSQRYKGVQWWPCTNRRMAEITVFRQLEYFWRSRQTNRL